MRKEPMMKITHCLLSAARSFVCSQVHWEPEVAHWEQVGSLPSHLIFFRLGNGERGEQRTRWEREKLTCNFHRRAIHDDAEVVWDVGQRRGEAGGRQCVSSLFGGSWRGECGRSGPCVWGRRSGDKGPRRGFNNQSTIAPLRPACLARTPVSPT